MKILLASDHGGFALKEEVKTYLQNENYEVEDMGNTVNDPDDDYPDFIIPLAEKVASMEDTIGIVFGRSGNGEQIAANKVKGVRAALCTSPQMAAKAREDDHANVLALGADYLDFEFAKEILETFLKTPFSNEERHIRRVNKINQYESAHTRQS
jgi:ribose 5-phosphate isomerase B